MPLTISVRVSVEDGKMNFDMWAKDEAHNAREAHLMNLIRLAMRKLIVVLLKYGMILFEINVHHLGEDSTVGVHGQN